MATIRSLLRVRTLFTAAAPLPRLSVARRHCRSGCRRIRVADGNFAAVGEADEAGGHYAFVCFDAALHDGLRFILFLDHDRSHARRVVVLDHVHEGSVWPTLNR